MTVGGSNGAAVRSLDEKRLKTTYLLPDNTIGSNHSEKSELVSAVVTIGSNIEALKVQRGLHSATDTLSSCLERLSSGSRINRASDDPAGLSISSGLKVDSRVYTQALRNVNDGISLLNLAKGALGELAAISTRQKELAEQAANGVYSAEQRKALDNESTPLFNEYNRIIASTRYNGLDLFSQNSPSTLRIQAGYGINGSLSMELGKGLRRPGGSGVFSAVSTYVGEDAARGIDVADFNGDGKQDLITANFDSWSVSVLLGNGDGSYKASTNFGASDWLNSVAVGDIDGDGDPDAIAFSNNSTNTDVFINDGSGNLSIVTSVSATGRPYDGQIVDVDGDSKADLVVTTYSDESFTVWLGNGNGSFKAPVSNPTTGWFNRSTVIKDLNADGRMDAVAVLSVTGSVEVFMGTGGGNFGPSVSYSSGDYSYDIAVRDFTGDGLDDIVVANEDEDSITLLAGNGNGTFKAAATFSAPSGPANITSGDFNGDNILDIVTASTGAASVHLLLGNGNGTFKAASSFSVAATPSELVAADLNGDGSLDLAISSDTDNKAQVLLGVTKQTILAQVVDLKTAAGARDALTTVSAQMERISAELGTIGAFQSRLFTAAKNLGTSRENFITADSRITDIDVASETATLVAMKIRHRFQQR